MGHSADNLFTMHDGVIRHILYVAKVARGFNTGKSWPVCGWQRDSAWPDKDHANSDIM